MLLLTDWNDGPTVVGVASLAVGVVSLVVGVSLVRVVGVVSLVVVVDSILVLGATTIRGTPLCCRGALRGWPPEPEVRDSLSERPLEA